MNLSVPLKAGNFVNSGGTTLFSKELYSVGLPTLCVCVTLPAPFAVTSSLSFSLWGQQVLEHCPSISPVASPSPVEPPM